MTRIHAETPGLIFFYHSRLSARFADDSLSFVCIRVHS
jgi:hypothetical protein